MMGEAAARGGHSCIGKVTVSGNRVRAGASGTRRRSVTRPTDPLKRLELSPSRLLRARCSFLCHRRRRRRRRRPSSSVQEPARAALSRRDSRAGNVRVTPTRLRGYASEIVDSTWPPLVRYRFKNDRETRGVFFFFFFFN